MHFGAGQQGRNRQRIFCTEKNSALSKGVDGEDIQREREVILSLIERETEEESWGGSGKNVGGKGE